MIYLEKLQDWRASLFDGWNVFRRIRRGRIARAGYAALSFDGWILPPRKKTPPRGFRRDSAFWNLLQRRLPGMTLHPEILDSIRRALSEDVGEGDATSESIFPPTASLTARILAKQEGVVAGMAVAEAVFRMRDSGIRYLPKVEDGARVRSGDLLAVVSGSARGVLSAERVALNFLGRMSGIATLTRRFVDAVAGTGVVILDTRKTAPGLRRVDKWAVRLGGGENHRMGLFDMILIKDNHIDFAGSLEEAVRRAREARRELPIEVETRTLEEVDAALALGVERILLDNMSLDEMREAVRRAKGRAELEASGNVTLTRVRAIAETGVTYISIGALTHSAPVFDVSMKILGVRDES